MIIDDAPVIPDDNAQDNPPSSQHKLITERRIHPDHSSRQLFFTWIALLPTLLVPFLDYINRSNGCIVPLPTSLHGTCKRMCEVKTLKITCLYYNRKSLPSLQVFITYPLCQILRPRRSQPAIAKRLRNSLSKTVYSPQLHPNRVLPLQSTC
jgi:hypothetical protein